MEPLWARGQRANWEESQMDNDPNQPQSSSYEQQPAPLDQSSSSQFEPPQEPPLSESPPQWGQQPLAQYRQPPYGQPQYGGSPIPTYWSPQPPIKRSSRWLWITLALLGGLIAFCCIGGGIVGVLGRLRPVTPLPGSFPGSGPREIIAGSDGALWFTVQDGDKIGRMTTQGTITQFTITTNPSDFSVYEITAGPDGAIWFMEDGVVEKIGRITTQGTITQFTLPTFDSGALGITAGPDGALWFIEYGKIGRMTTQGTITEFTIPPDLS